MRYEAASDNFNWIGILFRFNQARLTCCSSLAALSEKDDTKIPVITDPDLSDDSGVREQNSFDPPFDPPVSPPFDSESSTNPQFELSLDPSSNLRVNAPLNPWFFTPSDLPSDSPCLPPCKLLVEPTYDLVCCPLMCPLFHAALDSSVAQLVSDAQFRFCINSSRCYCRINRL